jgi:VWFA-related protein
MTYTLPGEVRIMARPLLTLACVLSASLSGLAGQNAPPGAAAPRVNTVFLSVSAETGAPVLDLAPADFAIKEDGKDREVLKAEISSAPLQVMVLVDDNGSGLFRSGLLQFVQRLHGRAEIAISTVTGQTQKLVDYTTELDRLAAGITTLSARPATQDGGQLLEGIFEAAKAQEKRASQRPVIIALTVGGEEHSTVPAHQVLDQLARTGSKLYVIHVGNTQVRATVRIDKPAALLQENLQLSEVLGEGPKQTGGWRDEIIASTGIVPGLQKLAEELKSQYAVEYSRAPKGKPLEKLQISVKRRGLTLRAPTKVRGR